jgi:hypothetical protein
MFIFIDTETSGLGGPKKQQLTQVSSVCFEYDFQKNKLKEFGTFNKKIKISIDQKGRLSNTKDDIYRAFRFNHYGNKIKEDPKYYEEQQILIEFKIWLDSIEIEPLLIMQNAIFDMNMLVGRGGIKLGKEKPYEVLDTKQIIQFRVNIIDGMGVGILSCVQPKRMNTCENILNLVRHNIHIESITICNSLFSGKPKSTRFLILDNGIV